MSIWHNKPTLDELHAMHDNTIEQTLGIEYTEIGKDYLKGKMPVDDRTRQPYGLLHGGASATLAETLGSMASNLCLDREQEYSVGLDIYSRHLKSKREGWVYGTARPLHLGRSTHYWEIKIVDPEEKLVNVTQLTMAVLSIQKD